MAVGVIMDFAGGSADQYDRVIDKMDLGGRVAEQFDERGGGNGGITHFQIVRLANMDQAAFEAADAQIRDDHKAPEHCMFHVNGRTDDGWIVADGWTSKEARDEFVATKVAPAMQAAGAPPPTIEDLPVHHTLTAR